MLCRLEGTANLHNFDEESGIVENEDSGVFDADATSDGDGVCKGNEQ